MAGRRTSDKHAGNGAALGREQAHMSEPFVGQVIAVGFNFAPVGWALCQGQLLSISENTVLFQLLGTTYGGDGQSTFGLPDLRGRAALGMGQGAGLQPYQLGQSGGVEAVTLTANQLAGHTHALLAAATTTTPTPGSGVVLGTPAAATPIYDAAGTATQLVSSAVAPAPGGGSAHENRQPSLVINYIISLFGVFPSQN
jgi:microcystin-dependent protein